MCEAADEEYHNGDAIKLDGLNSREIGPEAKEYNLLRANEEYRNGNLEHSIYYQVRALFQISDLRFLVEAQQLMKLRPSVAEILDAASEQEKIDYKTNTFMQSIIKYQKNYEKLKAMPKQPIIDKIDFLEDEQEPTVGFERISQICQQLPQEWCVVQLCKGFNPATTYSTFCDIAGAKGDIYVTMLRHCRSSELGPTCLRFSSDALSGIFKEYGTLVERYKRVVTVDQQNAKSKEVRAKYWKDLNAFEESLKKLISNLSNALTPYCYMFLGKRYDCAAVQQQTKTVYAHVDAFCLERGWSNHQRILLSQAALHANRLPRFEIKILSCELSSLSQNDTYNNEDDALVVCDMLKNYANEWEQLEEHTPLVIKRFPVVLVVDERMDHMHWEQLAPMQEFTRIKSLHNLWRLYKCHKAQIKHGYYTVNIKHGMTVINPDADLINSGRRLRSFLQYWLTHWQHLFETVPSHQVMTEQAFKADCFVYAGHGSTLQYVSSRVIYRNRIKGVVFLFGCDSTRMLSAGLYSAMFGAQDFYHGGLCPTVVGTLMPALDANMDYVSANVLSQWTKPAKQKVIPWTHIDRAAWVSTGAVQEQGDNTLTLEHHPDYQKGSLCAILANVQGGKVDPKIYNSCIYVCRGLPAWNLAVQKMPF